MSILEGKRQGSLNLVDAVKVMRRGTFYVFESRMRVQAKWWKQILLGQMANPVLYLMSVGVGVSAMISKNSGSNAIDGVTYLTFLAPALLASAAIQSAMDETIWPTMEGFRWHKTFFAMNATPLTGNQIGIGIFISALVRTLSSILIYFLILIPFHALPSGKAWLAIPAALFAGASFGAMMLAVAAYAEKADVMFVIINRFVIMPLFLFSGTFYPLNTLPMAVRWIGWFSPLWHATELGRYFTYGHSIPGSTLLFHFVFLLIPIIVGLTLALRRFTFRLAR